jgi:hypothetical protein
MNLEYSSVARGVVLLAAVALTGCGDSNPRTYPVRGKLVFADGEPVQTGLVEFRETASGTSARGTVAADGSFTLTTFAPDDGALPGTHQVTVHQLMLSDQVANPAEHRHGRPVPPRYGSLNESPLTAAVAATDEGPQDVVLTIDE